MSDQPQGPQVPPDSADPRSRYQALVPVPAASTAPAPVKVSRESRKILNSALDAFEQELGGRQAMIDTLAVGADAEIAGVNRQRAEYVLGLLADPRYEGKSLRRLAQIAGITLQELLTLYRCAALMRAQLKATARVAQLLPDVVTDVMEKSVPYDLPCERCGGLGKVTPDPTKERPNPLPLPCPTCKGAGALRYQPTLENQKVALTLGGMLKGGGGPSVVVPINIQQTQGQGQIPLATGETLVQLQRASDRLLYGRTAAAASATGTQGPAADPEDEDV